MIAFLLITGTIFSQDLSKFHLYNPEENAEEGISKAVKQAKAAGKHVFIQVGGNWCIWCARFHDMMTTNHTIDSTVASDYIVYHLNYSKENKNEKLLAKYGYPQRFGFPVFLILDGNGKLIHIQNSAYLEQGKGYDATKAAEFFHDWSPSALDPKQYADH
jgi:thioredoxin-related protein